jgi:ABC-2 type transport system permease protein
MNWEVQTMPSRTSFFNKTIFFKNIVRFWPVWALYLLVWLLVMPLPLWNTITYQSGNTLYGLQTAVNITPHVNSLAIYGGAVMSAVFGIFAAMAVFSYMYSSRSASMFHALPVKREGLFLSNYLSGLAFLFVPNVIVFFVTAIVEAACGYAGMPGLFAWLAVVTLLNTFFYSFGVLCAMVTGHLLALPVLYGIANFVVIGLEYLTKAVLSTFVFGMDYRNNLTLELLSPFYKLITMRATSSGEIVCWQILIGYACVGVAFAVLALLLYRKRHAETAGDIIAVKPLKPVFKYGAALCFALVFGFIIYSVLTESSRGDNVLRMLACMLFTGTVGYFAAEMLLRKSFRVFKRSFKGWLVFCAALAVLTISVRLDVFGYARYVPDASLVEEVYAGEYIHFIGDGTMYKYGGSYSTFDEADEIGEIISLHESIVNNRAQIEGFNSTGGPVDFRQCVQVSFYYEMKDGGTVYRRYIVPVTTELMNDPVSPASVYQSILNNPRYIIDKSFPDKLTEVNFQNGEIFPGYMEEVPYGNAGEAASVNSYDSVIVSQSESYLLYQAILKDIEEGGIGQTHMLYDETLDSVYTYTIHLNFSGDFQEWRGLSPETDAIGRTYSADFSLEKTSVNTIEALKSLGLLDEGKLTTRREAERSMNYYG